MVKKNHPADDDAPPKAGHGLLDSELANSVRESAQQIWLAGMGAFAKAQEEGTKVFESLVKEGQSLQQKTQAAAEERIGEVASKVSAMAESVGAKAGQNWDRLEGIFETRTAKALDRLGVPTAAQMAALARRVDELEAALARLADPAPGAAEGVAPAPAPRPRRKTST